MTQSRFLVAGLAAALASAALPAVAQTQTCIQPVEKTAFDVRALQSQLMVAALACGEQDKYNAFVTRHQGELGSAYRAMAASYRRAGGQKALDSYITTLANAQSQDGIRQGSHFCQNALPMFDAAMAAAANGTALQQVALLNNLSNPHGFDDCAVRNASAAAAPTSRTGRTTITPQRRPTQASVRPASTTVRR